MKRQNIIWKVAGVLGCAIISVVLELTAFNINYFSLSDDRKGILEISEWKQEKKDDKTIYNIPVNGPVLKLAINYETEKDVNVTIKYNYVGAYQKEREVSEQDIFLMEYDKEVISVGKTLDSIELSYTDDAELKITSIQILNNYKFNYYRAFVVFGLLLIVLLFIIFYKEGLTKDKLHIYFVTYGLILGTLIIGLLPSSTFYSFDDETHFRRSIEIMGGMTNYSRTEWAISGNEAHLGIAAIQTAVDNIEEQEYREGKLNEWDNEREDRFITLSGRLQIEKISYAIMAAGYNTASFLGLPFSWCFRIGKLFNLLAFVFAMAYAIKSAKRAKVLLFVFALMPTNIFLASNYSYDPVVLAGITVFITTLINILTDKNEKVTTKNTLIMLFSMVWACSAKAIYIPIALLAFFVPKDRFVSSKQRKLFYASVVGTILLMLFFIGLPFLRNPGGAYTDPRGGETSVSEQIISILTHPIDYVVTLKDTFILQAGNKLIGNTTMGGWGHVGDITTNCYMIYLLLLAFVAITDAPNKPLSKWFRIATFVCVAGISLLIWTALYLSFTPVGNLTINGVQGRYFIPLLLLILLISQSSKIKCNINQKYYLAATTIAPVLVIFMSIFELLLVNYCL